MLQDLTTNSISTVDVPSATESAQKSHPPRPRGRKGKAAAARDVELFRFKRNQKFDRSRQDHFTDKFGQSSTIEFGNSIFGNSRLIIVRPTLEFSLSTVYVINICDEFLDVLRSACKVVIMEDDLAHLVLATVMQLEAKVWFAQQGSPFASINGDIEKRARRVKAALPEAIFPISFYLDQIGKIEIDQQQMIPCLHDLMYNTIGNYAAPLHVALVPPGSIELPAGNALTGAHQWVEIVNEPACIQAGILVREGNIIAFTQDFLTNPNGFNWLGSMLIHPYRDVLPTFDQVVNRYNNLINRVNRRFLNALAPVDYSAARGTMAQLVTSRDIDSTSVEVWSNRPIDSDSLVCGALLRFGHGLIDLDASHSSCNRCVEVVVDVAGSLQQFVRNIMTRVR